MKCSRCGADIHTGEKLCPGCGMEIKRIDLETSTTLGKEEFPSGEKEQNKNKNGDNPGVMKGKTDSSFDPGFTQAPDSSFDPGFTQAPDSSFDPGFTQAPDYGDGISGEEIPTEEIRSHPEDGGKEGNKKWVKVLGIGAIVLVLLAVAAIVVVVLNRDTYTEEDAQALVKAQLDSDILGEYDEDFEFINITREEAINNHKEMIQNWVDVKQEEELFSDSLRDRTAEMWDQAFRKTNYSIGKAEEQDDLSFLVRVEIRPLDLYQGCDGSFYGKITERLRVESPEVFEDDHDLTPVYDAWWNGTLEQIMSVNLVNPSFRAVEYNTVRVYQEDDAWNADSDDISAVENKLFYYGSRWDQMVQN